MIDNEDDFDLDCLYTQLHLLNKIDSASIKNISNRFLVSEVCHYTST
jgi:hypothetical protein